MFVTPPPGLDYMFVTPPPGLDYVCHPPSPPPGLDYVGHEDVLPYTSSGHEPFTHELFSQFFVPSGEKEGEYVLEWSNWSLLYVPVLIVLLLLGALSILVMQV